MGEAIGEILPLAVGVALSPLPIVAVVLMLVTPRARVNGPAFVVGWLAGLAVVGAIVLLAADGADASDEGEPATWASVLQLLLGALLLLVALRQWRGRPEGEAEPPAPKWMGAIDRFTAPKALAAGVLLSGANPKNLLLAVAAATAIAQTGIDGGEQAIAYAVFAVIGALGVAVPVGIFFALGDRAWPLLARLKDWMEHNNAVIMAVLLAVIGAKLIGNGIAGL
jgi:threonine/homoserine/homoserine lactone efflux protein